MLFLVKERTQHQRLHLLPNPKLNPDQHSLGYIVATEKRSTPDSHSQVIRERENHTLYF